MWIRLVAGIVALMLAGHTTARATMLDYSLTLDDTLNSEIITGSFSLDSSEVGPNLFLQQVNLLDFDLTVNSFQYDEADLVPFFKIITDGNSEITAISALFSDAIMPDLTFATGDWDQRVFVGRALLAEGFYSISPASIPLPASLPLMGMGLAMIGLLVWRSRKPSAAG